MTLIHVAPMPKTPTGDDVIHQVSPPPPPPAADRGRWSRQLEFTLTCVGFSAGLANIWRFPYLCLKNGGGAFLIPYFTFLAVCGVPLYYLELCLGQYSGLSPLSVWKLCPLFKGIGWSMVAVSAMVSVYYNTVLAWILYFIGYSLRAEVPWGSCGNPWNTDTCVTMGRELNVSQVANASSSDGSANLTASRVMVRDGDGPGLNMSAEYMTPAQEFWSYEVLGLSSGLTDLGNLQWDLSLSLLAAWLLLFACLCRGVQSSGKVVYVSATLPYLLLISLMAVSSSLPGSLGGIRYYLVPDWSRLADLCVWTDACLQVFYSMGPAWGGLITMASYNDYRHNCLKDAVIVGSACAVFSFFGGFTVFSILGYMAYETSQGVEDLMAQGPGLAFIVYPEAIAKLPMSPIWSLTFFLTLFFLGIDCQFCLLQTVISGFTDEFPEVLSKNKPLFLAAVCTGMFLLGLPFVSEGGMYVFQIVDWYAASLCLIVIAFLECLVVSFIYGIGRFYGDMTSMFDRSPCYVWAACWCLIIPILLLTIMCVTVLRMAPPRYGDYTYPAWTHLLGLALASLPITPIPVMALASIARAEGSSLKQFQRFLAVLRPSSDWGPQDNGSSSPAARGSCQPAPPSWRERMDLSAGSCRVSPGAQLSEAASLTKCV